MDERWYGCRQRVFGMVAPLPILLVISLGLMGDDGIGYGQSLMVGSLCEMSVAPWVR